jgi:hypothetical protein
MRILCEIINGLELMNNELVDEVKKAKKYKHKPMKLYEKSKYIVLTHQTILLMEREEKNNIKDELTQELKVQQAQEAQPNEYKTIVETFESSKRSLSREVKIGRRGGVRWPLWVTKVCCELLVNGLRPSAILSSIGALFTTRMDKSQRRSHC